MGFEKLENPEENLNDLNKLKENFDTDEENNPEERGEKDVFEEDEEEEEEESPTIPEMGKKYED